MNLLEDDIEFVARYVRGIVANNGVSHVYVRPTGTVWVYKDGKPRSRYCNDECRIGVYKRRVKLSTLKEDLQVRLEEIKSTDMYQ